MKDDIDEFLDKSEKIEGVFYMAMVFLLEIALLLTIMYALSGITLFLTAVFIVFLILLIAFGITLKALMRA